MSGALDTFIRWILYKQKVKKKGCRLEIKEVRYKDSPQICLENNNNI